MNGPNIWKPAFIGGILLGVLSSLPYLNCACCIWVIGGGLLAAYLYVKESAFAVTLGRGVMLGFLTGVVGTAVAALFSIPLVLMSSGGSQGIAEQIRQVMDQLPGFPPESREAMDELMDREGFLPFLFMVSIFSQLVVNSLLAMIGGALGVALFEKRKRDESAAGSSETLPPPPPPDADV